MATKTAKKNRRQQQEVNRTRREARNLNQGSEYRVKGQKRSNHARTSPNYQPGDPGFIGMWNGRGWDNDDEGGMYVNENIALNFSAIYSAVSRIAAAIATMPIQIIKYNLDGSKTEVFDHPARRLLSVSPDGQITSLLFREAAQAHSLLVGNSYAEIVRNQRGQAVELHLLDPNRVSPRRDYDTGRKIYSVSSRHGIDELPNDRMLHIPALTWDGFCGMSPVKLAADTVRLGIATQKYGIRYFAKGGRPMGFLTKPGVIGEPQRKQYRQEWKELHEGIGNWFSVGVLSGGLEWKNIGTTPNEAQFLATRQFQVEEIARWYNIPPHMLAQMDKTTSPNTNHMFVEFAIFTLLPWIKRWESELNMKLFTRVEQLTYSVKFNMGGLLRADPKTRMEILKTQLQCGVITIDEWRELEERNAFGPGLGDKPIVMASQMDTLENVIKGVSVLSPRNKKAGKNDTSSADSNNILDEVFATN